MTIFYGQEVEYQLHDHLLWSRRGISTLLLSFMVMERNINFMTIFYGHEEEYQNKDSTS
jgi:hypothetical protein